MKLGENIRYGLAIMLTIVAVVLVIGGRVVTFHQTEGEALVQAWRWWAGAVGSVFIALVLTSEQKHKEKDDNP